MARFIAACLVLLVPYISTSGLLAGDPPLDIISVFHSDSAGAILMRGCTSPGDINGDGYSEIFVAEIGKLRRLHVFSGGDPPDSIPDMLIGNYGAIHTWLPDINNDGIQDFAMLESYQDTISVVDIWFGGTDFLSKTEPDLKLINKQDTVIYFGRTISSGDVNGDDQNDIIISAINGEIGTYEGRFYIYYGGDILDTFVDNAISFHDKGNGYNDFWVGTAVGDMNNDGLVDYVWSGTKNNSPGYIAVMYGKIPLDSVADYIIWAPYEDPEVADNFGHDIYPVGDINKDNRADFVIDCNGAWPCLFFGGEPFDTIPLILGDTTDDFQGGHQVANIGDINHDGWDDLAVGRPSKDGGYGIVYIYYGYWDMDGVVDLTLHHEDILPPVNFHFGEYLGPAGDFNGDGVDDLVAASWGSINSNWALGNVYVFAGDPNLPTDAEETLEEGNVPEIPAILGQNYPNPFNRGTVIEYELSGFAEREIELVIYNLLGQVVKTLKNGKEVGGKHIAIWDGTDDLGESALSGVYFYVLYTEDQHLSKKIMLLK